MPRLHAIAYALVLLSTVAHGQLDRVGTPVSWTQAISVNLENELLTQADVGSLMSEDAVHEINREGSYRFAYAREVLWNLTNSGTWLNLPNGDRLWLLGIEYAGAHSIALSFSYLSLPKGGKLYVYSEDHADYLGPLTDEDNRNDELGLPHIKGSKIFVEYYEPNAYRGQSDLTISYVAGSYRQSQNELQQLQHCHEWLNRDGASQAMINASASVIRILVDHGQRYANGVLVNNSAQDGTPYVLMSADALAGSPSSFVFQFDVASLNCLSNEGSCSLQSICGAQLKIHDMGNDVALLQLLKKPRIDWGTYYSGWNLSQPDNESFSCIQHVRGLPQTVVSYSGDFIPVELNSAMSMGLGTLVSGQSGAGSLGAPLFDAEWNLIGLFKGGSASCNVNGGVDRFVLIEQIWDAVGDYLNPEQLDQNKLPGTYLPADLIAPEKSGSLLVYPNPAHSVFAIRCSPDEQVRSLSLYNAQGSLVRTIQVMGDVSVEDLPPGVYMLRVETNQRVESMQLFVVGK